MSTKKSINKQGIIVISIAAIASIILLIFIFSNPVDKNAESTDKVILNEDGEASYLNLSVPNSKQKEDSLTLIDKLDKIKIDSINNSKLNSTGLDEYDKFEKKKNNNTTTINYKEKKKYSQANNSNSSSSFKKNYSVEKSKPSSFDDPLEEESSKVEEKQKTIGSTDNSSGFFKKKKKSESTKNNDDLNIYACIHTNQTIMNNQRVKFRSTKEFYYKGQKYPINTIIYGLAQINPNRLLIKVNKINQTDIKLEVYDSEDSEKGLYVLTPNLNASLQKELKREGLDDDDLSRIPFSKSLKNIFEKKVKEEKVELLNNYKVLIKICKDE